MISKNIKKIEHKLFIKLKTMMTRDLICKMKLSKFKKNIIKITKKILKFL